MHQNLNLFLCRTSLSLFIRPTLLSCSPTDLICNSVSLSLEYIFKLLRRVPHSSTQDSFHSLSLWFFIVLPSAIFFLAFKKMEWHDFPLYCVCARARDYAWIFPVSGCALVVDGSRGLLSAGMFWISYYLVAIQPHRPSHHHSRRIHTAHNSFSK